MPAPRAASGVVNDSPVPAYIVEVAAGLKTIDVTARLGRKSSMNCHDTPASVERQMPPSTPPAKIVEDDDGCTASARTRPPTLPGPSEVQLDREMSGPLCALRPGASERTTRHDAAAAHTSPRTIHRDFTAVLPPTDLIGVALVWPAQAPAAILRGPLGEETSGRSRFAAEKVLKTWSR